MMKASIEKYTLNFRFDAGTSRGVLKYKDTWLIKLENELGVIGVGEAGPLPKLSIDDIPEFESILCELAQNIFKVKCYSELRDFIPNHLPSALFGFQTAWLDSLNGGKNIVFENNFSKYHAEIPINGLVWMNNKENMIHQVVEKIKAGFECVKLKVGAIDFNEEIEVINYLRKIAPNVIIRLDANGAWGYDEALDKLKFLNKFNIHSIEQPLRRGNWHEMANICLNSPIDVALDEELINISYIEEKKRLLKEIQPRHIILKPTLLGGFESCDEWIECAGSLNIGWWVTSALESNVGLNAICQYAYQKDPDRIHGLGTGMLYSNNIGPGHYIEYGKIRSVS